jgi:hypothetical protein
MMAQRLWVCTVSRDRPTDLIGWTYYRVARPDYDASLTDRQILPDGYTSRSCSKPQRDKEIV